MNPGNETRRITRFRWVLMSSWTGVVAAYGVWLYVAHAESFEALNLRHARAYFEKDLVYRRWNAARGGLYAPLNELTPPNPYLDVPHRDVSTTSGRNLTLINPAYMTRQVHELMAKDEGVLGHITSLDPIRPENAADVWETKALEAFEQGAEEVSGIGEIGGKPYLRLMRPLFTEQVCLRCHGEQGYERGDVQGGISVSIPYEPIAAIAQKKRIGMIGANLGFWAIGLLGIYASTGTLLKGARARQKVDQQLRISEAKASQERDLARRYFDLAGALMVVLDPEGRILALNHRASKALGVDPEVVRGLTWFQEAVPEEWRDRVEALHRRILTGDSDSETYVEYPIRTRPGEYRSIAWRHSVIDDDLGGGIAILGSGEDVTERKRAEREIRALNDELEQRVLERTAELQAAYRELESFTYAVSHDLRAPLRAIVGFSQALEEDLGDGLEGDARADVDQILAGGRQMGELIWMALDLSAMAMDLLRELRAREPERIVTAKIEPRMDCRGDPRLIRVAMQNLLDNAWKYTAGGSSAVIRVYSRTDGGARCFCVSDNGVGFDQEHAGSLFKPFVRLHRKDEFPGIGVGLATVQRIVHRHGGTIRGEGVVGKGATFCFTIGEPGAEDQQDEASQASRQPPSGSQSES